MDSYSLEPLWKFLNLRQGLDASSMEWRSVLGDATWRALKPTHFQGMGIAASCRANDHDRILDVVPARSGYQLVCESTGTVAATGIEEADVRCYRLDLTALRRSIAAALGVRANPTPINGLHGSYSIGEVPIDQNMSVPSYMILPASVKLFTRELQDLCMRPDPGFIVLTSHEGAIDHVTATMIRAKHGFVCPLTDAIGWDGKAMTKLSAWDEIVESYRMQHLAALASTRGLTVAKPKRQTKKKRGERTAKTELLRKAVEAHLRSARDHAFSLVDRGEPAQLLPRPTQKEMAKRAGASESDFTRCKNDDQMLSLLWDTANDLEAVMRFARK